MILNTMIFNTKSGSISKKKIIFMAIGLIATKLWLHSRLDQHRVKSHDMRIIGYTLIALIVLIMTGWTIFLIKIMDTFIHYFGNTWLAFGALIAVIVLTTILGWFILKSLCKRLLKKLAAVFLIEKFFL